MSMATTIAIMKHFDNSREGNDCWIHEHWYLLPQSQNLVICHVRVGGWRSYEDITQFREPNEEMPEEVKEWFNNLTW